MILKFEKPALRVSAALKIRIKLKKFIKLEVQSRH